MPQLRFGLQKYFTHRLSSNMYRPQYFKIQELVCPDVHRAFGERAWTFFDEKLLKTLDHIREHLGPLLVNNWFGGGGFDERGFRCIKCDMVRTAMLENKIYVSAHMTGQGVDFDCQGMEASEVRAWITENQNTMPHNIRLENGVSWVHIDTRDMGIKIFFFTT